MTPRQRLRRDAAANCRHSLCVAGAIPQQGRATLCSLYVCTQRRMFGGNLLCRMVTKGNCPERQPWEKARTTGRCEGA